MLRCSPSKRPFVHRAAFCSRKPVYRHAVVLSERRQAKLPFNYRHLSVMVLVTRTSVEDKEMTTQEVDYTKTE